MNRLSESRQLEILRHLSSGLSIRTIAKLTGANRNTVHRISLWKEVLPDERVLKYPLPKYLMDRIRPDFSRLHAMLDCAETAWDVCEFETARSGLAEITNALRAVEKLSDLRKPSADAEPPP